MFHAMHDHQISVTAQHLASTQLTPSFQALLHAAEATLHVCIDVSMVYVAMFVSN